LQGSKLSLIGLFSGKFDPFTHYWTIKKGKLILNLTNYFRESSRMKGTMTKSYPPIKTKNIVKRSREYLTQGEIEKLSSAAKSIGRHGHRDATMIMVGYHHGLRVSELVNLKWDQVDFKAGHIHVQRKKNGSPTTQPITGKEIRALRRINNEYSETQFVFVTERKGPLTDSTFRKIIARAGKKADLGLSVHPHMLRHSTGFKLANDGQDTRAIQLYLGHKNIQHTVKYTELSPDRFKNFFED
jgi:integrase